GQNLTLDVQGDGVEVRNMAPGEIFVTPQAGFDVLRNLNLFGGRAHNTFNVLDTPAALLFVNVTTTSIFTGRGGDFVTVLGTHSSQLLIQGQTRNDFVTIGNGNLNNIRGPVKITNPPQFTHLLVNAINDSSFENVTMSIANGVGTIHGLAPQDI